MSQGRGSRGKRPPLDYLRFAIIAVGLLLPTLLLIPLGSIWLWQNGFLLPFVVLCLATTAIAYGMQRWLLPVSAERRIAEQPEDRQGLTPREQEAWLAVRAIAVATTPKDIGSREDALAIALKVFTAVAVRLEPDKKEPLWQFTAPEALAAIEQVSQRLRDFVENNVPLGDRLTMAQLKALYAWRGSLEMAQSAYDLYRLFRFINPAAALTNEVREQLTRKLMAWGKDHIAKQLTERFVEEVGRAAIDLYGGRLAVRSRQDAATQRDAAAIAARPGLAPIRILVAGQTDAGKSSLVNALSGTVQAASYQGPTTAKATPYAWTLDGAGDITLLDMQSALLEDPQEFVRAATEADLVMLVIAATRADREPEHRALEALREYFTSRPDLRPPEQLIVVTHIDRLRPLDDWSPPYDLASGMSKKAANIRDAIAAIAGDLEVTVDALVPVALLAKQPYNIAAVRDRLVALAEGARQTQLVRTTVREARSTDWGRLFTQAVGASRAAVTVVRRRGRA